MPPKPRKPLIELTPPPVDPAYGYRERWGAFNLGVPWGPVMLCLVGVDAGAFMSGRAASGVVLSIATVLVSLLVPQRWGLSRKQFRSRLRWLIPGAVGGTAIAVTAAVAGFEWGLLMFGTTVLALLAGEQIGRHEQGQDDAQRQQEMPRRGKDRRQPNRKGSKKSK